VLVSGNYFDQTGTYADDHTRIFTFNDLATPDMPATFCSPPDLSDEEAARNPQLKDFFQPSSVFNGQAVNLTDDVFQTFEYYTGAKTYSIAGGLVESCVEFEEQTLPVTFNSADDVLDYVKTNAGQFGRNSP
jgi:hypothetical protein